MLSIVPFRQHNNNAKILATPGLELDNAIKVLKYKGIKWSHFG